MNIEPGWQLSKGDLRRRIRAARGALSPEQRREWDARVNRHLLEYAARERPRVVAAYVAFDGEPDLAPALQQLGQQGVRLALPVIQQRPGRAEICFRQWAPGSEMLKNRYGIAEPVGTLDIRLDEIDLALIPLVAWDAAGGRLGMGASFYDRMFEPLAQATSPCRMGVAYRLQQVQHIPLDPWDVRLHGVLTEDGCLDFEP